MPDLLRFGQRFQAAYIAVNTKGSLKPVPQFQAAFYSPRNIKHPTPDARGLPAIL
ncbi:hypothetical protein [Kingella sp. (in: b-proteobacteria)]|uniref:hypothetical protein n=1 Tax=Kingella sp. (in: b-proteobacteria) TaxID=2020713 RepID=UPI0026DAE88D|nr:hypothetical protein [Kingella sp. (in: b-proteobacteria)]MDO4657354.1 hypothetical protein [Kingella sp. (in: b-proteobacteria)]